MSDRVTLIRCARAYLAEASRRRSQHSFHALLLQWAANARRRAARGYQPDLFGGTA